MAQSPAASAIQSLAAAVLNTQVIALEYLDGYLPRTYQLSGSSGSFCLVKYSPAPGTPLLALEEERLSSEASVLSLLARRVDIAAPKLLEYQAATAAGSYVISGPYFGKIMSSVSRSFSESDRFEIDQSYGTYLKRLTSITHTAFGSFRRPVWPTWPQYFASLLETVLKDAEGAPVELPYDIIRGLMRKHWVSLDKVKEARLVLLESSCPENLVIDARDKEVTSIVDYSTAIWGDPFMADAFYRPTRGFLAGFGDSMGGDNDKRIRQILYICFHALLIIVRQQLRPRSNNRETEARTALTTGLKYLDQIPV